MKTRGVKLFNKKASVEKLDNAITFNIKPEKAKPKRYVPVKRRSKSIVKVEPHPLEPFDVEVGVSVSEEPVMKKVKKTEEPSVKRTPDFSTPPWVSKMDFDEMERTYMIKVESISYTFNEVTVTNKVIKGGVTEKNKTCRSVYTWFYQIACPKLKRYAEQKAKALQSRHMRVRGWKLSSKLDPSLVTINDCIPLTELNNIDIINCRCRMISFKRFEELLQNAKFKVDVDCSLRYYDVLIGYIVSDDCIVKITGLECPWILTDSNIIKCNSCQKLTNLLLQILDVERAIDFHEKAKLQALPYALSDDTDSESERDRPSTSAVELKPKQAGLLERPLTPPRDPTIRLSFDLNIKDEGEDDSLKYSFSIVELQNQLKSQLRRSNRQTKPAQKPQIYFDENNSLICHSHLDFKHGHTYYSEQLEKHSARSDSCVNEHSVFLKKVREKVQNLDDPSENRVLEFGCNVIRKQNRFAQQFQKISAQLKAESTKHRELIDRQRELFEKLAKPKTAKELTVVVVKEELREHAADR